MKAIRLTAILAGLAACDSPTPPTDLVPLQGTWAIQSINGKALPYTATSGSYSSTVLSDTLRLHGNGSWASRARLRRVEDGVEKLVQAIDTGTYSTGPTQTVLYRLDAGGSYLSNRTVLRQGDRIMTVGFGSFIAYRKVQ